MVGRNRRGYSLIELMVALFIVVLMLGMALAQYRSPQEKQGPQAAAMVVAEAFRAARSQAMSTGIPTALVFPSGDGATASSQAYYLVEGAVFPRIVSITDLAGEYPRTALIVAQWPVSGATNSTASPPTGDDFVVDAWGLRYPRDYAVIFLPSGRAVSNGLVHFDSAYHVLVSAGAEVGGGGGAPDSPGVFSVSAAAEPWTVSVSFEGLVSVEKGLASGSSGLEDAEASTPTLAAAPPLTGQVAVLPEIVGIRALPQPPAGSTAADALVPPGGRLTLVAEAWSPEGVPLFCEWSGSGFFSTPGSLAMTWDPVDAVWTSRVEWTPPDTLATGEQTTLQIRVEDQFGNQSAAIDASGVSVEIGEPQGRLAYDATSEEGLWVVRADGSDNRQVVDEDGFTEARWSPDGTKFVALKNGGLHLVVPGAGTVKTLVTKGAYYPRWSPDGTRVLYSSGWVTGDLWVVNADGTGNTNLTADIPQRVYGGYAWSPDGQQICFTRDEDSYGFDSRIWVMDDDGSGKKQITDFESRFCNWSPDGKLIAVWGRHPSTSGVSVIVMPPDGLVQSVLWSATSYSYSWTVPTRLGWSPDSSKISFQVSTGGSNNLRTIDVTTRAVAEISGCFAHHTEYGVWSPGQNKLACFDRKLSQNIVVANDDGTKAMTVAEGYYPHWAR